MQDVTQSTSQQNQILANAVFSQTVFPADKPGYKTSEFYVASSVISALGFLAHGGTITGRDAATGMTYTGLAYVIGRIFLKWLAVNRPQRLAAIKNFAAEAVRIAPVAEKIIVEASSSDAVKKSPTPPPAPTA